MKTKIKVNFIDYTDPVLDQEYHLKIEELNSGDVKIRVAFPEEKSFFRGVDFQEFVKLEKLKNGKWIKILRAKFGAGAEELFGLSELHEESELEARDIRIIAAVEKMFEKHNSSPKRIHSRVRKVTA